MYGEPEPLRKTNDYIHEYHGLHSPGALCRIRIYEKRGEIPVVIATELPTNMNTSITNLVEYLAAEVIAKHFPQRFEEERPITWIEHYPPIKAYGRRSRHGEFSLVDFTSYTPRRVSSFGKARVRIGEPSWHHLSEEEVERLVGERVEAD